MSKKTADIHFRATPEERATLRQIQRAYGLKSLSEAARRAIRAAAEARALAIGENHNQGVTT